MWTDKLTKDELGVVNACRDNKLRHLCYVYGDTAVFNILEKVVAVMADELDREASWNHSFRFQEEFQNPLGPDAGWQMRDTQK
jgi:hypothetical protein